MDDTTPGSLLLNHVLEASKIGTRGPAHVYITHLTTPTSRSMQLNSLSLQQTASHYIHCTEPKTGHTLLIHLLLYLTIIHHRGSHRP